MPILAVPHRVIQDDVHAGFFIPKGSLVIANVWSVSLKRFSAPLIDMLSGIGK